MINADTRGSQARVTILDDQGRPLSGFDHRDSDALQTNVIHHTMTWNGKSNVAPLEGKAIKLKFQFRQARLFSFGFVD